MRLDTLKEMAARKCNNWTPETASLIATLKRHGFVILQGNNGEYGFQLKPGAAGMKEFIGHLIACDEAHLFVKCPKTGKQRWLYLVLGNDPGEIVNDNSIPAGLDMADDPMEKATEEHYNRWSSRKQPTFTYAEAYPDQYGPEAIAEKEAAAAKGGK